MSQNPLSVSAPRNLVADGYAETTMLVFEQFADEAIAASKLKLNSTVLDVACGPGTLALRLAQHAKQIHGIDFFEAMLAVFHIKIRSVTKAFPVGSTAVFWDNMVKGSAPIQMMKKSIMSVRGEPVEPHSENMGEELWREKEKLALAWLEETLPTLKGALTSDAWLGVGIK
jgi:hypothetical protein